MAGSHQERGVCAPLAAIQPGGGGGVFGLYILTCWYVIPPPLQKGLEITKRVDQGIMGNEAKVQCVTRRFSGHILQTLHTNLYVSSAG